MQIPYATREQVSASLEIFNSAHAGSIIDARILSASQSAQGFLHRRFYPEQRTIMLDWPNYSYAPTWEVDLGDQELISVEQVLSGGVDITAHVILRRDDDLSEPPYTRLQVDLSSSAALSAGPTFQRSLSINGLFGHSDTAAVTAGGALVGAINDSATVLVINPATSGEFNVGVGSLLLLGTERMLVMNRRMSAVSGQTLSTSLDDIQSAQIVAVTDGTKFVVGEVILIDGERMRINDVAGNNLIVDRAWDGSTLAEHTSSASIYALRTFVVARGVLGSTAAAQSDLAAVHVHQYPALLNELVIAESVVLLEQNSAGYSNTVGSSANTTPTAGRSINSAREAQYVAGLADIRERAWRQLARKARSSAI